jgi:hypothetical protein
MTVRSVCDFNRRAMIAVLLAAAMVGHKTIPGT